MTEMPSRDLIAALDEASLSRFHLRAVLASGIGFFTDAYDLFVIGVASALITKDWNLSPGHLALLNSTMLFAAFVGAFVFGRFADVIGRNHVYWLVAAITIVGALGSAFAPSFWVLIAFRFVLGFGVGGDYPVSAVMVSEYANRKDRGKLVGMVLVVEDEESISDPLSYMLRKEGFEVVICPTGPDALEAFDLNGADLVLLDLVLPGAAGTEVCRCLRERSDVPVIMLT